jgi:hypothetical protein
MKVECMSLRLDWNDGSIYEDDRVTLCMAQVVGPVMDV